MLLEGIAWTGLAWHNLFSSFGVESSIFEAEQRLHPRNFYKQKGKPRQSRSSNQRAQIVSFTRLFRPYSESGLMSLKGEG